METLKDMKSGMLLMHYGKVMETLKDMKSGMLLTHYGKVMETPRYEKWYASNMLWKGYGNT